MVDQQTFRLYEFGPFRLSLNDRLLYSGNRVVSLTPKLVDTLIVLLESSGHVVTKDSLMKILWPDSFVEESSLTQNISLLRKALAEIDRDHYIETIPKRGYRFIADVREVNTGGGTTASNDETIFHESTTTRLIIEEEQLIHDNGVVIGSDTATGSQHQRQMTSNWLRVCASLAVLCLVVISTSSIYLLHQSPRDLIVPKSIAVLPFKTIDSRTDGDVIGLGMANAVILGLSSLKDTKVLPTSSVFQYTKREKNAMMIGRDLGVDAVLDGTVQRVDDQVRVTALLIRSSDGKSLWSGKFDAKNSNTLALQESISRGLTSALSSTIQGNQKSAVRVPRNIAAYDSFLFGLYFLNKSNRDNITKAISYFNQSIREDPDFALSHALLADCYFSIGIDEQERRKRTATLEKAQLEATTALQLDSSLPEAYTTLGMLTVDRGDYASGESLLHRAIELDPNNAMARLKYGTFLYTQARFTEAEAELKAAQELAPLSPTSHFARAVVLFINRDYDGVISACKKALELQPENVYIRAYLAQSYALKGMFAEAEAETEAIGNDNVVLHAKTKIYIDGLAGRINEAKRTLRELEQSRYAKQESPYEIAIVYAAVGDKEKALASVEKTVGSVGKTGSKRFLTAMLKQDPQLDSLRGDVRFTQYVARLER